MQSHDTNVKWQHQCKVTKPMHEATPTRSEHQCEDTILRRSDNTNVQSNNTDVKEHHHHKIVAPKCKTITPNVKQQHQCKVVGPNTKQ